MDTGVLAQILGPDGLIVVAVLAVVLLFGGRKLPELARGLGSASHQFKKGIAEGDPEEVLVKVEVVKPDAIQPPSASVR